MPVKFQFLSYLICWTLISFPFIGREIPRNWFNRLGITILYFLVKIGTNNQGIYKKINVIPGRFDHWPSFKSSFHSIFWTLTKKSKKCPWKIECLLEDLFLGSQWSIILGNALLSVESLNLFYEHFQEHESVVSDFFFVLVLKRPRYSWSSFPFIFASLWIENEKETEDERSYERSQPRDSFSCSSRGPAVERQSTDHRRCVHRRCRDQRESVDWERRSFHTLSLCCVSLRGSAGLWSLSSQTVPRITDAPRSLRS